MRNRERNSSLRTALALGARAIRVTAVEVAATTVNATGRALTRASWTPLARATRVILAVACALAASRAPGATIGDVWRQLAKEFPELAHYERSISSAVNADYARMDQPVGDGDEVAFLPPVSGGC